MLNQIKGAIQDELDAFISHGESGDDALKTISKAAFTKARKFLKYTAFVELNQRLTSLLYDQPSIRTWCGFRLCAIDGSKITVPNTPECIAYFGGQVNHYTTKPQALISQCFDVINHISLDVQVKPYNTSEREIALSHLQNIEGNHLYLYDRGYPCYWLMNAHSMMGKHFCMRMPASARYESVHQFMASDKDEVVINVIATRNYRAQCKTRNISSQDITLRLIKIALPSGETEVLATNLLDSEKYPHHQFQSLYHLRWGIEEDYKQQKHSLKIEAYSGKSVHAVLQDIHAKVLTKNLSRLISFGANGNVKEVNSRRAHTYQINFKQVLAKTKFTMIKVISSSNPQYWVEYLVKVISRNLEPIRPGRNYPRKRAVGTRGAVSGTYKPLR